MIKLFANKQFLITVSHQIDAVLEDHRLSSRLLGVLRLNRGHLVLNLLTRDPPYRICHWLHSEHESFQLACHSYVQLQS